jgi:ABC-type lipoprotein export system ATPase subunit
VRILSLDMVSKSYGTDVVLKNVSFGVEKGDFIAVVGVSGAGKTTLLGIMGGLERPSSGRILFGGEDLAALSDRRLAGYRNKSVGFIHQMFNLIPFLTAAENVMVPMVIGRSEMRAAEARSNELLDFVGLKNKAALFPKQLSGGEQQRVAVARALSNEPDIILADEPTANLDEKNAQVIIEYLQMLARVGKTVVVATHDPALAQGAGRTYTIEGGVVDAI